MVSTSLVMHPASQCLRQSLRKRRQPATHVNCLRSFTTTFPNLATRARTIRPRAKLPPIDPSTLDPKTVTTKREERLLLHHKHVNPIGSRRRRALQSDPTTLPFEQLPYQCFQEARKILAADREEKLAQIADMRARIGRAMDKPAAAMGGEYVKKGKLVRMQKHVENLKILADANDPMIRKRFEDGLGDMNRPIYRHLALRKWSAYNRKLIMQRIEQLHLVPDILPHLNPTVDVSLKFGRRKVAPGEIVDSRVSEIPARLQIQVFDKGERMVSIAVVDPDVPDEANDTFGSRCHYLAINVPIAPDKPNVSLRTLKQEEQVVLPWLPPFSQKGAPYHRLAIFVLQQKEGQVLDLEGLKKGKSGKREAWGLPSFTEPFGLSPVGVTLFRTVWDEGADEVARRAGYEDAVIEKEFVRKKPEKNYYKKKDGERYR